MKIAVVGSLNMDMTVTSERIPKRGETLVGKSISYIPGGKGANQAVAISRLGTEVEMFGCVGNDSAGVLLIDNLKTFGVKTDNIKVVDGISTGMAFITVAESDNTIIVVAGANDKVDIPYINSVEEQLKSCDIVVLQHEIPIKTVEYVIDFCYKNLIQIILNPAPACPLSMETIEKVTYLTPNEHEAAILFSGEFTIEELLKKYPEKLVITQGSKGVSTCLKSGEILLVPARKVNVVDTTGAGDTLNGAFAVQIASGSKITDALYYANAAASLSVEKFGAQGGMPTCEEVEKVLCRNRNL